jgi:hypothetical protein
VSDPSTNGGEARGRPLSGPDPQSR